MQIIGEGIKRVIVSMTQEEWQELSYANGKSYCDISCKAGQELSTAPVTQAVAALRNLKELTTDLERLQKKYDSIKTAMDRILVEEKGKK